MDTLKRHVVGESITWLQEAKSRIRAAPSRSGSGAEPPPPKKPSTEETPQDISKGSSLEQESKEPISSSPSHNPPTLKEIADLFKTEMDPIRKSISNFQTSMRAPAKQMGEVKKSVTEKLTAMESRIDATDSRVSKLEELLKKGAVGRDLDEIP